MKKVITYGTFDLLHYGHIKLLERAKKLGDYLIVGVTSDDYDISRGKINSVQSLMERIENVKNLNLADEIIVEEYAGQKIDDIIKYDVDIFAIGSDWKGKFDYLNEYCEVVYLERTQGISSTDIRSKKNYVMNYVGDNYILNKYYKETGFVNGLEANKVYSNNIDCLKEINNDMKFDTDLDNTINSSDALYILSTLDNHYDIIKKSIECGKHVLCESPITNNVKKFDELVALSKDNNIVLMDSIKTAYSLAYHRLLLLVKGGAIGNVVSIDATCTSMRASSNKGALDEEWTGFLKWGPTAMLPIFDILGVNYTSKRIVACFANKEKRIDKFTNIIFEYPNAIACLKVGKGFKSEGNLVISGTKGCIYVSAPWWKMDYFEIHYENIEKNKKFFYQLDGEGIRNLLVKFSNNIKNKENVSNISIDVSRKIVEVVQDYYDGKDLKEIEF